ncbi:MAG TPA: SEC-C metal-binding domain-containing protein, partial [Candidatus Limnocylindria bacterium]|nr:SEC-C metal-binding domain-containing protein [Candidatus Limnocylindria bacterium]
ARTFFDEMTNKIAYDVAQTILRISVRTAEQAEQEEKNAAAEPQRTVTTAGAASSATLQTNRAATATATAPSQKLGRNDPCWCGSGKKYKKCHGR